MEYDCDGCGDADEDDGDGKTAAVRHRLSVEMDDGWMTESDVDDSQDDKNSSEIGLRLTGAEEQQPEQWRVSPIQRPLIDDRRRQMQCRE